jgi:3-hydroxyisobutyrate dehydrogenase-like beta-hydroxyacid dehydrogenase
MRIGFLGIGRMGEPMARSLVRAGHAVVVHNRTPERAAALADHGARVAADVADAVAGAELVITMLADDAAVEATVLGPGGVCDALARDAVHASMSTVGAALTARLAAAHAARAQGFVAAPVFGRPEAAAAAKLFVIAAGDPAVVARCEPAFAALGQQTFVVGDDPAAASVVKLAGNFLLQSAVQSMGEAFALAQSAGVHPERFLDVMTNTLFPAPVYRNYGAMIAAGSYEPPGFALELGLKDVRLALEAAEAASVPMPVASVVRDRFVEGVARGYGKLDMAALGRVAAEDAGQSGGDRREGRGDGG